MKILPKNTTVYTWFENNIVRTFIAEYVPTKGYKLVCNDGTITLGVFARSAIYLTKTEAIETEMKKTFDRLIELEIMKRALE